MGKSIPYGVAALPGALLGAGVPYAAMKKREDETDRQFNARRRGMMAALGTVGAFASGGYIQPKYFEHMNKLGSLKNYFNQQAIEAGKTARDTAASQRKFMLAMSDEKTLDEAAKERARKREENRQQGFVEQGLLNRGFTAAGGASLIGKNVPMLGAARGRQMLYHGTGARGAEGIFGEGDMSGLRLEYAGTKNRANSWLMPNAVVRTLLEDENLSDQELARIQSQINTRIKTNQGTPIGQLIAEEIDTLAQHNNLSADRTKSLKKRAMEQLSNAGLRIYFGNSPEQVVTWTDDAHEGQKLINAIKDSGFEESLQRDPFKQQKVMARSAFNIATGGLVPTLKDLGKRKEYYDNLETHSGKVSPAFIRNLAKENPNLQFVLGTDVMTDDVESLADFKGIKTPLRLSPALQSVLGSVPGFEGYDPNRDISTARNVAQSQVKHVDVVDPSSGKTVRYALDSYKAPKLTGGQRLKALGKASVPLGLTALGADLVYRGISGRRGVLGTAIDRYRKRNKESEKTASKFTPYRDAAKNTLLYGVPLIGVGAGTSILEDAISRRIMPVTEAEYAPQSFSDDVEGIARETARGASGAALKAGIGIGVTALGAAGARMLANRKLRGVFAEGLKAISEAKKSGKMTPELQELESTINAHSGVAKNIATAAGGTLPMIGATLGGFTASAYRDAARGQDATRAEFGETPEEQMETPWKSAILPAAATALVGGSALASASKHFPGLLRKAQLSTVASAPQYFPREARKHLENASSALDKGQGVSPEILELATRAGQALDNNAYKREFAGLEGIVEKIRQHERATSRQSTDSDLWS